MNDEQWLTVNDVAEKLSVNEGTVRRWLRTKKLKGKHLGGKAGWRVSESEVERFMNQEERA